MADVIPLRQATKPKRRAKPDQSFDVFVTSGTIGKGIERYRVAWEDQERGWVRGSDRNSPFRSSFTVGRNCYLTLNEAKAEMERRLQAAFVAANQRLANLNKIKAKNWHVRVVTPHWSVEAADA